MPAANKLGIAIAAVLTLSACGGGDAPNLMNLRTSRPGPDEFAILPTKPLQMPQDINNLPRPTPGGSNLTDPTPQADAVAALGGNPASLQRTGRITDTALVAYASRAGVDPSIRAELAASDLEYRKNNKGRLLDRAFGKSVYSQAYGPMSLDQSAELERWRRAGAKTPSAPPSGSVAE
ncbi:DUF3035 domain-containing protein [Rhodobacteraceae bacterium]|nr:DUF3035 domain-containing protein [Paracoccaceae bacterium]